MSGGKLARGLAACVTLATLLLAGCGKSPAPAATVGYPQSAAPVTIDFWYMPYGGPIQDKAVADEANAFHGQHPNITVRPVRVPWNDALIRMSTASTSGGGPDVTQIGTTWVGGFAKMGALRPFQPDEIEALGGQAAFVPASWTSTHLVGRSDTMAMPWLIDIRAIYYRTDLLKQAGLEPVSAFSTWKAYEAALAKLRSVTGKPPLAIGTDNSFGMIHAAAPYIWGAGGDLLSADGTQPAIDQPAAERGITYYQSLLARYNDPKARGIDMLEMPAAFADGLGAITEYNSQSVADFQANPNRAGLKSGWSTAPVPAGPEGAFSFVGGSNLSIWKSSKNPGAAFEWVKFLTGQESQQRFAINSGLWPARASSAAGTKLATDPAYAAFASSLKTGRQYPPVAAWVDVETVLAKDLGPLWSAGKPSSQAEISGALTRTVKDMREVMGS